MFKMLYPRTTGLHSRTLFSFKICTKPPPPAPFPPTLYKKLQRVRLAHLGRCNCYQLLSDITGMPDISLPFILLYDCYNFIWSFRCFECIIIWTTLKKYATSQNNMTGTICAIPECKSRHGKRENFEVFLNSVKFSKIFLKCFRSANHSEFSKILP